jgi:FixJ family two-component response regulator
VDDDQEVRESLNLLIRSIGLNVKSYVSAEEFLDRYEDCPGPPRCLILDIRMPGLSGLDLQERLLADNIRIPIVVITGYGDVSMAVRAMDAGAVDFIEKPFSRQQLLTRVQEAIDRDAQYRRDQYQRNDALARLKTLSPRELNVMELMVAGRQSKQIGYELSISEKTVAKHRMKVFSKMNVDSVASLAYLTFKFALTPSKPSLQTEFP